MKRLNLSLKKINFASPDARNIIVMIISIILIACGTSLVFAYSDVNNNIEAAKSLAQDNDYVGALQKIELAESNPLSFLFGVSYEKNALSVMQADFEEFQKAEDVYTDGDHTQALNLFLEISEDSHYFHETKIKIEEVKRKMTEKELEEVMAEKEMAEKRATAEAQKKRVVEQKLFEKEEEDKRMNADNDGDGLTYAEELKLGSSDSDSDSDGDGIKDNEDMHPDGGGRQQAQSFSWNYGGYNWTWDEYIHEDWYEYYKNKTREEHGTHYVTSEDPFIEKVAEKITSVADDNNLSKSRLALSFVQNLSYIKDIYTGHDEYPKYPIETFFEKNGDCEDSSYLFASILDAMNIGGSLLLLPGHMAIGVWGDCENDGTYYKLGDRCYFYAETTDSGWDLGEAPTEYANTIATIIELRSENTAEVYPSYNTPCESSSEFYGYYHKNGKYYSDYTCSKKADCLPYNDYYYSPRKDALYHDSSCTKEAVAGCLKSSLYLGYYYDGNDWYYDHRCTQVAQPYYY